MSNPSADPRRGTNPLFSDNKLKLGIFATNVSNGCAITTAEEAYELNWPNALSIAEIADRHGYEAMVPVARWKGFGGESNFNGTNFETYTWAAGLSQATKRIGVLTTSHVPTVHPVMAAKQATTVDHISNGRFALNIVCGWFRPELEMFGAPLMEHDMRYEYAAEWIEIVKMLWTREDEFDYEGRFLRVNKGFSMPKPIQKPFPPLMNAGASGKGQHFAAKYADMAFIHIDPSDLEKTKAHIAAYRRLAREEYGRDIQIWIGAPVTQRDTRKEAEDYVQLLRRRKRRRCRLRQHAGDPEYRDAQDDAGARREAALRRQARLGRLSADRHRGRYRRRARKAQRHRCRRGTGPLGRLLGRAAALA